MSVSEELDMLSARGWVMVPNLTAWVDDQAGAALIRQQGENVTIYPLPSERLARLGMFWLGMLGFALAGPVGVIAERERAGIRQWMDNL